MWGLVVAQWAALPALSACWPQSLFGWGAPTQCRVGVSRDRYGNPGFATLRRFSFFYKPQNLGKTPKPGGLLEAALPLDLPREQRAVRRLDVCLQRFLRLTAQLVMTILNACAGLEPDPAQDAKKENFFQDQLDKICSGARNLRRCARSAAN